MAARFVGTLHGSTNGVAREFVVGNGVTVTEGDFVYFASGVVTNATVAGARLAGVAVSTVVGNGTRKVKVLVGDKNLYVVDNDNVGTTFAATHVGQCFDLVGATGAQLVDTSTVGASGSLVCVEYNPQISPLEADTSQGLFMIAESAFNL